jgi:hypothetical protein
METSLKTFEDFFNEEVTNIPSTEGEAIDDYADSLDSDLEVELDDTLKVLFDNYGQDVVIDAIKRKYL